MRTGRSFVNPVVRGALLTAFGALLAGGSPQRAIAQTSETYTTLCKLQMFIYLAYPLSRQQYLWYSIPLLCLFCLSAALLYKTQKVEKT